MNIKTIITTSFKVLAIVLTLSVMLPTAVKASHLFTHHTHEVCENDNDATTHFHESDLDCDFYKFKLTQNNFFVIEDYDLSPEFISTSKLSSYYISFNTHQYSTRFLRGPPQFV
ncbi:hypothetical protein [Winogradskyella flava]|uniref:hypothetical protein n=1 Tax=Winogradskyella flava TaxID=1884876 RepID=UPI002490FF2D|nr:hypothetical protein [Winogradskyella flava]